ncbi:molybdopterin-guanine dinucleotide biosynthesis protein B [Ureibacillus xyleni]|uniref:Molybdopterin-guanine dinucleotide biosynthesis protein B n=1 Tax=Ureibacillus xyleni TaxID=614648 RepID=A0A285RZ11_9BACL|nr:molybdopterin-guanine dinucleotide biosynthesis protein B [Ureibacillus xyleni]SOB99840.1 molybdopterin-guanine dinucleotide biosynthesis protein B [Ureibacillus xyleni]
MESMKILQIVGFKKSGKTSLIQRWIQECRKQEMEVAVVKHHGHSNGLSIPNDSTDSMKFFVSGAVSAIVADEETIQIHQRKRHWTLEHLIAVAKNSEPQILFIEGYKEADYPKVAIIKTDKDWDSLKQLSNIMLVLVHDNVSLQLPSCYSIHDISGLNNWLTNWIGGKTYEVI